MASRLPTTSVTTIGTSAPIASSTAYGAPAS
jgi:hypothetical protein